MTEKKLPGAEMPFPPARASIGCLASWIGARGDYEAAARKANALRGWRRLLSTGTMEGRAFIAGVWTVGYIAAGAFAYNYYKRWKANKERQLNS